MKKKYLFILSFLVVLCLGIFVRFYQVTKFPPSLYWEEIALGYDAYSILKTGKDHLGNPPPIVAFESYGDYKPALYFYLLVPSIAAFGLNEFAVRLPAMIAGVLIVIGVGILARQIARNLKINPLRIQILGMALTAISPWAILFSRAAWEVNVATCFLVWGAIFGLSCTEQIKRKIFFTKKGIFSAIFCFLLLALSMYTYHAARVIAPLFGLAFFVMWCIQFDWFSQSMKTPRKWWKKHARSFFVFFFLGALFLRFISPLLLSLRDKSTQERLAETNIFADGHVVVESNHYQELANHSLIAKIFYHRYVLYTKEFFQNYFLHFRFDFLFVHGDQNLRHSVQFFGQLYFIDAVFLLFGFAYVFRHWKKDSAFLIFWLFVAILPAALTNATPHALRILPSMPAFLLLITFGVYSVVETLQELAQRFFSAKYKKQINMGACLVIFFMYAVSFVAFWHFYANVYSKLYSGGWQYGYRQIVAEINKRKPNVKQIYFTRELDRPAMAYWFFSQTDPRKVQPIDHTLQRDQGSFLQFENITFVNFINEIPSGATVASSVESMERAKKEGHTFTDITEIKDLNDKTIWAVYTLN
jgi:4-amino-4-deoxy-L-arabinose transferase-like glycosyltransferase